MKMDFKVDSSYNKELKFAKKLAIECAAIAKNHYRSDCGVTTKEDFSPVTEADMAINWHIIQSVSRVFPDHGVIGEEQSWNEAADLLWVCDPLDGTLAFIYKIPTFMVSIALVKSGQPVVAVAINPITQELYWASRHQGAWRDGQKLQVSDREWGKGTVLAGSSTPIDRPEVIDRAQTIVQLRTQGIIKINVIGAVIKGCMVSESSADGCILTGQHSYDLAAVSLVIQEAGGQVTDCDGKPISFESDTSSAVFSNGRIHDELLKLYQGSKSYAHNRH